MKFRTFAAIPAVFLLATLYGCATKNSIPELPATLGNNGLVVARLRVLGMEAMENATVDIDGKMLPSSLRDGYIAVSLEPGEHKLNQVRATGQLLSSNQTGGEASIQRVKGGSAPSYIYVPGSSYTVHYTTLSVDRPFQVEPGKVTNLGLIVYMPVREDPDKKRATVDSSREFRVVTLDNSAEANSFLETNYPELVASLKDREIILSPGKYLDAAKLPDLRRVIAYYESRGPRVVRSPNMDVVYGCAGTIVVLNKPATGDTPVIDIVDTGTLADIVGGARNGEQFTFLTSDAKLLSLDGSKVTQTPFPYRVQPVLLRSFGESAMIVVDNHMRILTSRDRGEQWSNYEGAMIKKARSDLMVASDNEGAYISLGNRGIPESIYYLKAGESAPKPINRPENKVGVSSADWHVLVARDAGLFVLFNKPDFYFWSKAVQHWEIHTKPKGKCKPMKFDTDGRIITIECDGAEYRSTDSGALWTKPQI